MSLKDWLKNGWLIEHQTSTREIEDLLKVTDRDLADCQIPGLSTDGRFGIAYAAALQAATAALAASGYRASREALAIVNSYRFYVSASPYSIF